MPESKYNAGDIKLPRSSLTGIWRGVVEDNNDPLKAGRCRVRIFGVHTDEKDIKDVSGIPTEHLLWAEPATPIFGGISKIGIYGVPEQGSHVFLFFERNNIMQPRYFASAPGIPGEMSDSKYGFYDPSETFPSKQHLNTPDWNENFEDGVTYPNGFIIADKVGNKLVFDSTEGKERIILQQGTTGARIIIDENGSIKKESSRSTDETVTGSQKILVDGDISEVITGDKNVTSSVSGEVVNKYKKISISGGLDETVMGNVAKKHGSFAHNIQGSTNIKSTGAVSITSDNSIKLKALTMNLENTALLGAINNSSMTTSTVALLTATYKGLISTTIGGGIITSVSGTVTTVSGDAILRLTGGIILIG